MSRSNVHVRTAELADVPGLVALADSVKIAGSWFTARHNASEQLERLTQRFTAIIESDRRTALTAVDDADHLLGFVVVLEDEVAPIDPTPVLQVSHLLVQPGAGALRDGIGRALLAAVVRVAEERDIDHIVASASTSSREANRFFARLGFAPLVIRRIATTSTVRRSLGVGEVTDRVAARRRLLAGLGERPTRVSAAARALTREV